MCSSDLQGEGVAQQGEGVTQQREGVTQQREGVTRQREGEGVTQQRGKSLHQGAAPVRMAGPCTLNTAAPADVTPSLITLFPVSSFFRCNQGDWLGLDPDVHEAQEHRVQTEAVHHVSLSSSPSILVDV